MLRLIETFKVVYEEMNFTLAAEKLFIAQPTVSMHIQKLEEELSTTLFIRDGRKKVIPTQSADILYIQGKAMLTLWQETHEKIQQVHGQIRHTCKIGASNTIAVYVLPLILKELKQDFPMIDFEIYMSNSDEVLKNVRSMKWDFGLIETTLNSGELERIEVLQDELVLAGKTEEDFWLLRESGSGTQHYTHDYLMEFNLLTPKKMLVESNEMIVKLLEKGIGKSIISKRAVGNIPYQSLPNHYQRFFYLIRKKDEIEWQRAVSNQFITRLKELKID
ncbi:LysR substrate-binding domain-containing protein [Carnobacterium maltaromaticum]|uniref:LysR substrate-binding domain-containing protein n=1 Tax=Carnobacterium maltaromaticum TaxID=2751 RepID=UPI0039BEB90B